MIVIIKLLEFVVGAAGLIAWVTVLGLLFSKVAPEQLRKKTLTTEDYIAMAGIGLFCTFATLFFLFLASKVGLAKIQMSQIFGSLLSGSHNVHLIKWAGRILVISLGVIGSFSYGSIFFKKIKSGTFIKGFSFSLTAFVVCIFLLFPLLSIIPAVQMANLSLPAMFGPLKGSGEEIMTLLAATLFFGALLSNIYHQWEEV